ncbi:hypothetical protein UNSWDHB_2952 [Dehalobacter sp. UNSWDHB]|jgi:A/G-specific adenine glycosylase|uniref:A/G-specific adenine glycosylase n=1 Tax=unclassified Dehalobacter TaxID=2635733 RepID=UPI00028AA955|nr:MULTISPECIES: A/G-specific adenine glycosylase [unclassified Dehalobacter]AFV01706.1 A/G-specific adenine glycosylase [Dehalobacter sp. DCA]AFV04744.1 A/G-specific adenine glycosylase [Dehalobacter sp. CF]EQB22770.1 hypothetical protein UNSWDHB_2952 [Dehalobacter sp. UNSWDHB]
MSSAESCNIQQKGEVILSRSTEKVVKSKDVFAKSTEITDSLLAWYDQNKRDLPWRRTNDPYAVWLSEIMLQQTRVDTVIDYYLRFLERFPDICSLADADEEDVLTLWKGLGYYRRARNLHQAAVVVRDRYSGNFPRTYPEIRALPGIGDYTAGAIASIAYNLPYPAVDGNVLRVITRLLGLEADISQQKTQKQIAEMIREMIPKDRAGEFTQALMELGAMCCTPNTPGCRDCPWCTVCTAHRTHRETVLPVKKKAKKAARFDYWTALVYNDGDILMEYRSNTQLLGNMWGLPLVNKESGPSAEELYRREWELDLRFIKHLGSVRHVFTHQVWQMDVILFSLKPDSEVKSGLAWISREKLKNLPIPKAFQKVLQLMI